MAKLFSRNKISFLKISPHSWAGGGVGGGTTLGTPGNGVVTGGNVGKLTNELTVTLRGEIMKSLQQFKEEQSNFKGLVIFGEKNFSFGSDIVEYARGKHFALPQLNEILALIEELEKPVVACMSGGAYGTGFELALGCHWRLATRSARMGLTEANIGLIPSGGGSQRLPRAIGMDKAVDWIATAKEITPAEGLSVGLIDEIAAHHDELSDEEIVEWTTQFLSSQRVHDSTLKSRLFSTRTLSPSSVDELNTLNRRVSSLSKSSSGSILPSLILRSCLPAADANVSFQQGLEKERHLFNFLAAEPQTKAILYNYLTTKRAEKLKIDSPKLIEIAVEIVNEMKALSSKQALYLLEIGVSSSQIERACQAVGFRIVIPQQLSPPSNTATSYTDDEIISTILYPMINFALNSLAKELYNHSTPLDGSILDYISVQEGLFPPHSGGPMWYAEKVAKFSNIVKVMKEFSDKCGDSSASGMEEQRVMYKSGELLESLVESGSSLTEELYFRRKYPKKSSSL